METVRWVLTGLFTVGGAIISLLVARELKRMDTTVGEHKTSIGDVSSRLSNFKLHVAETYVSKTDLEKQLDTHLGPIRDDMRELRGDVKALLQRQ